MVAKKNGLFLLCDITKQEIDEAIKNIKKTDGIIIGRTTSVSKEFDSNKYYERAKIIIEYLRSKGIKNDIILQCTNYNELKDIDIDDKHVGFIYDSFEIYGTKPATISEIKEINEILDMMVDNIRISDISELEKFIACYKIVVSFKPYLKRKDTEHTNSETSINEVLYNDYILCGGYSYLLMELLIRVGINSKYYELKSTSKDVHNHARLLVSLESGYYVCDPTNGLKVRYYSLSDYLSNYNVPFKILKEMFKKDFDANKINEYVSKIENDKKLYTKFKNKLSKSISAEGRLMGALFGLDKVVDESLLDLKNRKRLLCSDEIASEFEAIKDLNPTLRNKKEMELLSRKYKELPVVCTNKDELVGSLLTVDERVIQDANRYTALEYTFLDFYDKETFYSNIIKEFSNNKKKDKVLFQLLFDILNELFPNEFKDLCNRYPKVVGNLVDLNPEIEQFLFEAYELLLSKNNNEISIEDIVLASSNVEQKVLGLNEEQRKKYYDDTLKINKKIKGLKTKNQ